MGFARGFLARMFRNQRKRKEILMRYLAILWLALMHLDAVAQQGGGAQMNVDQSRINAKLREFTVHLSSKENPDLVPAGIILRGAYRMHALGKRAKSTAGAPGCASTLHETSAPAETFIAVRAVQTLLDARAAVSSERELGSDDLHRLANLFSLAEQIENEELEAHYRHLIGNLAPEDKKEVDELVGATTWSVNHTRLDWAALVSDSPDVAELLIRHSCANKDRLLS